MRLSIVEVLFVLFLLNINSGYCEEIQGLQKLVVGAKNLIYSLFTQSSKLENANDEITLSKLDDSTINSLLSKANHAINEGNYEESIPYLAEYLLHEPNITSVNTMMGNTLLALNQLEYATFFLYTAVETTQWKDIATIYNLGDCFRLLGDYNTAIAIIHKGLNSIDNKIDSTGTLAYALGSIYESAKNYTLAGDWYLLSAQQTNTIDTWIRASTWLFPSIGRDLVFAKNVLLESIQRNPFEIQIMFYLALTLHQQQLYNEAILLYQEILHRDPEYSHIYENLATAYHANQQYTEALNMYKMVMDKFPSTNTIFLSNYAYLLCSTDNTMYQEEGKRLLIIAYHYCKQDEKATHKDLKQAYQQCNASFP